MNKYEKYYNEAQVILEAEDTEIKYLEVFMKQTFLDEDNASEESTSTINFRDSDKVDKVSKVIHDFIKTNEKNSFEITLKIHSPNLYEGKKDEEINIVGNNKDGIIEIVKSWFGPDESDKLDMILIKNKSEMDIEKSIMGKIDEING